MPLLTQMLKSLREGNLGFIQLGLSCWAHFFFFSFLDAGVQALKGKESPER